MKALHSSRIYFEDGVRAGFLLIGNDKIAGYCGEGSNPDNIEDYGDLRIIPGIFDTHNHGTYGKETLPHRQPRFRQSGPPIPTPQRG